MIPKSPLREQRSAPSKIELCLENIGKSFSDFSVMRDVIVSFTGGEIHPLRGENGAGKSTPVKIIRGVQRPTTGTITHDDDAQSFAR